MAEPLLIAQSKDPQYLLPQMANRHGLVAGATGTGKTVTLQVMAEAFSRIGVPVFAAELPEEQREVFIAHELEGISFKEMAAETGVNLNTLLGRKRNAVRHMRERLQGVYDEFRKS